MNDLDTANYNSLSFDCYGTLIDWENGILGFLQPLLESYDVHVIDEWLLEFFAEHEPVIQAQGGSYRNVLSGILTSLGTRLAFSPDAKTLAAFADSMAHWQPFADSVDALASLRKNFELVALSNVDDDLFAASAKQLDNPFSHIVTAGQVGAYKPDMQMFDALLKRAKGPILHVAQSRFHDIVPATELGLDTVWINRPNLGAAKAVDANPTWTFDSMAEFAAAWV